MLDSMDRKSIGISSKTIIVATPKTNMGAQVNSIDISIILVSDNSSRVPVAIKQIIASMKRSSRPFKNLSIPSNIFLF